MSGLLKEVLALGLKSEAAAWVAVEAKVLSGLGQVSRTELVKITNHFGVSNKGTNALWAQLDKAVVSVFPQLTVDETEQLITGFGEAPASYELSEDLDNRLSASWEQIGQLSLQKIQEKDPYFAANIVKELEAGAPDSIKHRTNELSEGNNVWSFFSTIKSSQESGNKTYVIESADSKPLRSAAEQKAFVLEKAQAYLKVNPESKILDLINSK